jgi:hypothetical protein
MRCNEGMIFRGQDRTGQDRTGQDRTGHDRAGQDRTGIGIDQRQNTTLQSSITCNVVETLFHLIEICNDTIQINKLCEILESRVLDPLIKSSYFILLSQ